MVKPLKRAGQTFDHGHSCDNGPPAAHYLSNLTVRLLHGESSQLQQSGYVRLPTVTHSLVVRAIKEDVQLVRRRFHALGWLLHLQNHSKTPSNFNKRLVQHPAYLGGPGGVATHFCPHQIFLLEFIRHPS